MAHRYKKPRMWRNAGIHVIGEWPLPPPSVRARKKIKTFARQNLAERTPAEKQFERFINSLGNGILRGKYEKQWIFQKYIYDFYFPEVRLAVEIDGSSHSNNRARLRDAKKTAAIKNCGADLLRLTNAEVLSRKGLYQKFRAAYKTASNRQRSKEKLELSKSIRGTKKQDASRNHQQKNALSDLQREFEIFLDSLGKGSAKGALKGKYVKNHPIGNYIFDFFFPEIRLAVNITHPDREIQHTSEVKNLNSGHSRELDLYVLQISWEELWPKDTLLKTFREYYKTALIAIKNNENN